MSKAKIKDKVKLELAISSGGCCERCGEFMYEDFLTKTPVKFAEHAHIIPDSSDVSAPRAEDYIENYDKESSENLMALCSNCHTIIDKNPTRFKTPILKEMKRKHEERIRYLLSLKKDKEVNTIIFSARIKNKYTFFNKELLKETILTDGYYEKNNSEFDLSCNISISDDDARYYNVQVASLLENFESNKRKILERKSIIFSLAPQPLLIKLGMLLNKTCDVIIKQKTRVPEGWCWVECPELNFQIHAPKTIKLSNEVCIVFAISDNVCEERIQEVITKDKDIWQITVDNPNTNCVLNRNHIDDFSILCNGLLNKLVSIYGKDKAINIFPVMPNSLAIEFGRNYLPKIHNDMILYDHVKNEHENKFIKAFSYIRGIDVFD